MSRKIPIFPSPKTLVVGSFGDAASVAGSTPDMLSAQCDVAEIRLDLFHRDFAGKGNTPWSHLTSFPLLFTARRHSEGSPSDLSAKEREALLRLAMPDAALIDIETSSISEMGELIDEMHSAGQPWIASYHDFEKLPSREVLSGRAAEAKEAGAVAFKVAAMLLTMDDLTALAHFQMSDQQISLCTMGMGVLAPVSRLLCAQAGSMLNYGFIGETETAPGQWSARQLRDSIHLLNPLR